MLALRTGHEELELTEAETKSFMTAAQNVARHHSIETTQKTIDYIAFLGVTAQVFGTRILAVVVKEGKKRRAPLPPPTQPVQLTPALAEQSNGIVVNGGDYHPSVPAGPLDDDSVH